MGRTIRRAEAAECRRCSTYCDRVIAPSTCVQARCAFLYAYEDPLTDRRYMGCMQKVFGAEIDFDLFLMAERAREGFGGIKMTGDPLPHCQFSVEKAYEGDGPAHECVNRRFFDAPQDHPEAIRAFDLRNSLT
jgi:hypothetical protein